MAGITTFLDPAKLPGRTMEQRTFDAAVAYLMQNFPRWGSEVNDTLAAFNAALASLNSIAAGGAFAIPFRYSSSAQVADPGAGYLRLNNANLTAATQLILSATSAAQKAVAQLIDMSMASTSATKASVRISSLDGSRYVVYKATTIAQPAAGYLALTVQFGSMQANNFVEGETLLVFIQPNGDKGDTGASPFTNWLVLRSTQLWTPPNGITKAEITLINGGYGSGYTLSGGPPNRPPGGAASISIRPVSSTVTYTAAVGAGGVARKGNDSGWAVPGGASSFSGAGLVTLTTSNGDIIISGGDDGSSLYARPGASMGSEIGKGAPQVGQAVYGVDGTAGAVIIRY